MRKASGKSLAVVALAALAAVVAVPVTAFAEVNQPQEIIDRPLTTPGGQITVGGDLFVGFDPTTMALDVFGSYGVNDKLDLRLDYIFALKEFEAKGIITPLVGYTVIDTENFDVSGELGFSYDLLGEAFSPFYAPLTVGARVQFNLNKKLALISPGKQLNITIDDLGLGVSPIFLAIPVGVGYQLNSAIFVYAFTEVAEIEISDYETGFIFADFIPLSAGAFFSPGNSLDVGAAIDLGDLKADELDFALIFSARLHM